MFTCNVSFDFLFFPDLKRPISMPEVDDFDEDLTSVKLHWKPRAGPSFDKGRSKYLIESWEPVKREWFPVARDIPDTSYQLRGLPAATDRLFRVRLESEQAGLSEPSVPVSVSRFFSEFVFLQWLTLSMLGINFSR